MPHFSKTARSGAPGAGQTTDFQNFLHELYHTFDTLTAGTPEEAQARINTSDNNGKGNGTSTGGSADNWAAFAVMFGGTGEIDKTFSKLDQEEMVDFWLAYGWVKWCETGKDPQCPKKPKRCTPSPRTTNAMETEKENCE